MPKPKPLHIAPLRGLRDGDIREGRVDLAIPAKGMTIVPDNNVPNRKWFANLIAAAITWLVINLGLDDATAASVAAPVAGLVANYLWAEWRSLPETIRSAAGRLVRILRREG